MKHSRNMIHLSIVCLLLSFATLGPARGFQGGEEKERHHGRVSINVSRGVKIAFGNRTSGRITVKGWDRDVVEAHAVSTRGEEVVIVKTDEESSEKRLLIKADYADLDQPGAPTSRVNDPPQSDGRSLKIHLEVNVPRYAEIGLIRVWRSDLEVSGVETLVAVWGDRSSVLLKDVGAAEVRTTSGNVEIDGVNGLVAVATSSGAIRVSNSKSALRAGSIAGPIEIKCSAGRVDVSTTEAPIELVNIDADVDAIATNSSVRFTGKLRDGGRYYLKSMSGRVEMLLPANPSGFNATLSSYRGLVESDFTLITKQQASDAAHNRRRVGTYGNGKAQITLDSFEGFVRLTRLSTIPGCN
ncbi:MAG: hypothetical protein AABN95_26575 [Acidobacteriota bacterium]